MKNLIITLCLLCFSYISIAQLILEKGIGSVIFPNNNDEICRDCQEFDSIYFQSIVDIDQTLFPIGNSGTNYHGFPSITVNPTTGRVWAGITADGENHATRSNPALAYTDNEGSTWTRFDLEPPSPSTNFLEPQITYLNDTLVVHYYSQKLGSEESKFWIHKSVDDGATWIRDTIDLESTYDFFVSTSGRIIQNATGQYLLPFRAGTGTDHSNNIAGVLISNDLSFSSYTIVEYPIPPSISIISENNIILLYDGRLILHVRSDSPAGLWQAESSDGGLTWTVPTNISSSFPVTLHPTLGNKPNLILLSDGSWLTNVRDTAIRGHTLRSFDQGQTWSIMYSYPVNFLSMYSDFVEYNDKLFGIVGLDFSSFSASKVSFLKFEIDRGLECIVP